MEPNNSTAANEASTNCSQAASASNTMQSTAQAAALDARANQENQSRISDVVVVGAGPAGMTSALYMARAGFRTLVLEALVPGGQLTSIDELENYPGFGGGVNGFDIAMAMQKQAERFGVQFAYETATALEHSKDPAEEGGKKLFKITTNSGVVLARSVIIATGAKPLKLPQIDSDFLEGKGLSYCATCDGNFYRGKDVVIVGGGDTACAEAIYLSRICRKVYVVHRREDFRAHFWYAEKVKHLPNVEIFWNSEITNVVLSPQERIESVVVRNINTGEEHNLPVEGLFVAIGAQPESQWVRGAVKLDKYGYVEAKSDCHTSLKGVYVAGDVRTTPLRQVVTATADGALAAEAAVAYLSK